jgi:hypothetical protein
MSSEPKAFSSPLSTPPNTVGGCLDLRKNIDGRITSCLNKATNDASLTFWHEGSTQLQPADSQVKSILDRFAATCELNEIVNAISVLKKTDVVMPSFCDGVQPVQFTLGQLRDTEDWFLPLLKSLVDHLTAQGDSVRRDWLAHDRRVEQNLLAELDRLKREHEEKKKEAKKFNDDGPSDDELLAVQETAKTRSKTLMAISVDPVGIKNIVANLSSFVNMIGDKNLRNTKIDATNSVDCFAEMKLFEEKRQQAFDNLSNGTVIPLEDEKEGFEYLSLADLKIMIPKLKDHIAMAIPKLRLVSFKRGQNKDVEHPDVVHAKERLYSILYNLNVLIQCRQVFREGNGLNFPQLHPLSKVPLSVDGLVRLGFVEEKSTVAHDPYASTTIKRTGCRGRGKGAMSVQQRSYNSSSTTTLEYYSLAECLDKLHTMLDGVEQKVSTAKKEHDQRVQESVNTKQEARTKSATALKPGELDDIAKSVRTDMAKVWTVADGMDRAITRVTNLSQQIAEMQSSHRKSANSNIKVLVPKTTDMNWALNLNALDGW